MPLRCWPPPDLLISAGEIQKVPQLCRIPSNWDLRSWELETFHWLVNQNTSREDTICIKGKRISLEGRPGVFRGSTNLATEEKYDLRARTLQFLHLLSAEIHSISLYSSSSSTLTPPPPSNLNDQFGRRSFAQLYPQGLTLLIPRLASQAQNQTPIVTPARKFIPSVKASPIWRRYLQKL